MTRRPHDRRWSQLRAAILAHSTRCHICGQEGADQVDHVTPIALGGAPYDLANLRPAHARCNVAKGARITTGDHHSQRWA